MRPASFGPPVLTSTLLVIGLFAIPARGQSDHGDCDGNTAEVTACLIEHYKRADADLNAVYQRSIKSATEYGPPDLANLEDAQRKWIAYRDAVCEAELALYHGGTASGPARFLCLLRTTDQRKHDLKEAYLFGDGVSPGVGQVKEPTRVFTPALDEIRSKTTIPILLPSKLPSAIPESEIKLASGEVTKEGYFITLYYSADTNASYAAGFSGSTLILQDRDLPSGTRTVLSDGRTGIFRPVSCGGSCAPANLWWEQSGVMYNIQVRLSPDLPKNEQQRILVETANSTVAVQ
jgi:uncharacterized protein YecT (DUF1311 family)